MVSLSWVRPDEYMAVMNATANKLVDIATTQTGTQAQTTGLLDQLCQMAEQVQQVVQAEPKHQTFPFTELEQQQQLNLVGILM
jgi:ClpP class serine protease